MDEYRTNNYTDFEDRLTSLGESEMAMFRFLLDKPAGVILTVGTDKILAQLLEAAAKTTDEIAQQTGATA